MPNSRARRSFCGTRDPISVVKGEIAIACARTQSRPQFSSKLARLAYKPLGPRESECMSGALRRPKSRGQSFRSQPYQLVGYSDDGGFRGRCHMNVTRIEDCPVNHRGGQVSYLLLNKDILGAKNLLVTWVEGATGSEQPPHRHEIEQVYVIVSGRGLMTINDEQREVTAGTLVFIPPGSLHSIRNIGDEILRFISAASPAIDLPPADSPFAYTERASQASS